MIERLDWDSSFFGLEAGRVRLTDDSKVNEVLKEFNNSQFDLIYLFSNPENIEQQKSLEETGIFLADQKVLFAKQIKEAPLIESSVISIDEMVPGLVDLALQSGEYSRFKKDPRLTKFYEPLYKEWILKSLQVNFDDVVYIVKDKADNIQGLVTIRKSGSSGRIGLIAVDRKFRGSGIGSQLIEQAENWCISHSLKKLEVITQMDNKPATKFYSNSGFTVRNIENIYHLWK